MNTALLIACASILVSIVTAATVWSKNTRKISDTLYLLTSTAYILLGITNYISTQSGGSIKLFYARSVMFLSALAIVLTYHLIIALLHPSAKKTMPILSKLQYGGILAVLIISFTPLVINGLTELNGAQNLDFGIGMVLYVALSMYFVSLSILTLVKVRRSQADAHVKDQARLLLIGFLPVFFIAPITGIYLPTRGNLSLIGLTPVYSAFFVLMVGYAMLRHKLFDIRGFVLRAAAYTATTGLLAIVYLAPAMFLFMYIMDLPYKTNTFILSVLIGTIVASNYYRLQSWFNKVTSGIFFRDSYNTTELMADLNKTLVRTINVNEQAITTSKIIEQRLKSSYCRFMLRHATEKGQEFRFVDQDGNIQDSRSSGLFEKSLPGNAVFVDMLKQSDPLRDTLQKKDIGAILKLMPSDDPDATVLGYMIVGVRKSGRPYDLQDVQILTAVSDVLVIAMQNALHYEEIQKFNVTLQGRVEDATRKLRTTNDKLKRLDETKDEFISMASHQLRTPLTSIKGYLSMVLEGDAGKLNSQQEEMLKQSYMSSQRMVNLIADLLNLSRLNTGKFVIDPSPTDLRMIVDQEVGQLRETAKAKGLTLNWVAPKMFTVLPLDDGKIHQVVMNFIDNAIYYTPPGGSIDVTLVETPTAVEFRVKDNGIGVPRSVQHHLFTKFYRAENARQARPDGTGLGIFMAKKVIAAQGGSILFESKEGKGSTFGFRFNKEALKTRMAAQNPDTLGSPASKPVST